MGVIKELLTHVRGNSLDDGNPGQIVVNQHIQRLDCPEHRYELVEPAGDLVEETQFYLVQVLPYLLLGLFCFSLAAKEQTKIKFLLFMEIVFGHVIVALLQQAHLD